MAAPVAELAPRIVTPPLSPHLRSAAVIRAQLTPRETARKAEAEADMEASQEDLKRSMTEIDDVAQEIASLHTEAEAEAEATRQPPAAGMGLFVSEPEPERGPEAEPHWMAKKRNRFWVVKSWLRVSCGVRSL